MNLELTTLVGLILAITGLLGGMYFKHVPFTALANGAAIFMILIGTVGAVLNAFPMRDIKKVPKLFGLIFFDKDKTNNVDMIKLVVEYSQLVRKEGILILESKLNTIPNEFLKRGITMLLSGQSPESVEETMAEEIDAIEERHNVGAAVFTQAGTYAPTLGVLGAVVGLIAALGNMDDTEALGHAISAAFIATVYGIFTGYVLWHPFSNKLKRKAKEETLTNVIILQGILAIARGESPNIVEEKMISFLPKSDREKFFGGKG